MPAAVAAAAAVPGAVPTGAVPSLWAKGEKSERSRVMPCLPKQWRQRARCIYGDADTSRGGRARISHIPGLLRLPHPQKVHRAGARGAVLLCIAHSRDAHRLSLGRALTTVRRPLLPPGVLLPPPGSPSPPRSPPRLPTRRPPTSPSQEAHQADEEGAVVAEVGRPGGLGRGHKGDQVGLWGKQESGTG